MLRGVGRVNVRETGKGIVWMKGVAGGVNREQGPAGLRRADSRV